MPFWHFTKTAVAVAFEALYHPKECFMEAGNPNMNIRAQLDLQHIIHIFSIFGGVDKATRAEGNGVRSRSGRGRGGDFDSVTAMELCWMTLSDSNESLQTGSKFFNLRHTTKGHLS
jgi:hypothetical protein